MTNSNPTQPFKAEQSAESISLASGTKPFSNKQYNHASLPNTQYLAQFLERCGAQAFQFFAWRNSLRFLPFIACDYLTHSSISEESLGHIARVVRNNILLSAAFNSVSCTASYSAPDMNNQNKADITEGLKGEHVFDSGRFDHPCAFVTSRAVRAFNHAESAVKEAANYAMFIGRSDDINIWPDSVLTLASAVSESAKKVANAVYNMRVEKAQGDAAAMRSQLCFLMLHDYELLSAFPNTNTKTLAQIHHLSLWGEDVNFMQRISPLTTALLELLAASEFDFMAEDLDGIYKGKFLEASKVAQYANLNFGLMKVFI